MSPQATDAFNNASGTTVAHLSVFLAAFLFVGVLFWALILLNGKIKSMSDPAGIDVMKSIFFIMRILLIVTFVLLLVSV